MFRWLFFTSAISQPVVYWSAESLFDFMQQNATKVSESISSESLKTTFQEAARKIEEMVPDYAFSALCSASDSDQNGDVTLAEYHRYLTRLHKSWEIPASVVEPQLRNFKLLFEKLEVINFVPGTSVNISKFITLLDTVRVLRTSSRCENTKPLERVIVLSSSNPTLCLYSYGVFEV